MIILPLLFLTTRIVTNTDVFNPRQPIFEQPCLAHALQSSCKAAVVDVDSNFRVLDQKNEMEPVISIDGVRKKLAKCITWTKKSQKGHTFLFEAQAHCNLKQKQLITPVKTRFAYLILSFCTLLKKRVAINYLYGEKFRLPPIIRTRKPTWKD